MRLDSSFNHDVLDVMRCDVMKSIHPSILCLCLCFFLAFFWLFFPPVSTSMFVPLLISPFLFCARTHTWLNCGSVHIQCTRRRWSEVQTFISYLDFFFLPLVVELLISSFSLLSSLSFSCHTFYPSVFLHMRLCSSLSLNTPLYVFSLSHSHSLLVTVSLSFVFSFPCRAVYNVVSPTRVFVCFLFFGRNVFYLLLIWHFSSLSLRYLRFASPSFSSFLVVVVFTSTLMLTSTFIVIPGLVLCFVFRISSSCPSCGLQNPKCGCIIISFFQSSLFCFDYPRSLFTFELRLFFELSSLL